MKRLKNAGSLYLSDLELDLGFLQGTLEAQITYKKLIPNYYKYNKTGWIIDSNDQFVSLYYPLFESEHVKIDSLKIHLYKDIIFIAGPFDHFSVFEKLIHNDQLRNGYQNLVKKIGQQFGVKRVVYFSEWCYKIEELNEYEELEIFLQTNQSRQVKHLWKMEGNQFYIEEI